jgi:hypothetical protein
MCWRFAIPCRSEKVDCHPYHRHRQAKVHKDGTEQPFHPEGFIMEKIQEQYEANSKQDETDVEQLIRMVNHKGLLTEA